PYLVVDGVRNANRTGLGERFEPRGDVYAIAEDIVAIDDDVAEIDPNPQLETTLRRDGLIDRKCGALHLNGAAERVDHTRKIGQQAVARRADNPPSMSSDQGVDGTCSVPTKASTRCRSSGRSSTICSSPMSVTPRIGTGWR